jgi:osmoprotectant transport system ATP-binding protein
MTRMLTLQRVSKRFGSSTVLFPVDLTVEAGQTTVLLGPSGSGKSTLLRLMVGLLQPDDGVISFEGEPITPSSLPMLRQRMGYVIQDGGLFPHMTARANITLMARHLGWPLEKINPRVVELADLTHFPTEALQRFPAQLSGGQRQRVALMRALMLEPTLLLLDEPMAALDPLIRHDLQQDLKQIFQKLRKTVVLVTHDLAEAGYLGDRVLLLNEGCIVQQGQFDSLFHSPSNAFVTRFIQAQRMPGPNGNPSHETEAAGSRNPVTAVAARPDGLRGG